MFEDAESTPQRRPIDPAQQAREKAEEFRIHAELAAVFEGVRKFDAGLYPGLEADLARDLQRALAALEKSKTTETGPILPPAQWAEAARLLDLPNSADLSFNDYHLRQRPGETLILRWLKGEQVELFYERLQAHFEAALTAFREEERQALQWKQDPRTLAYLQALETIEMKMAERYLRQPIRQHGLFVLSTLTADELDILHLCDYVMGVPSAEVVGRASAPPDAPTERDRAWFFKLFSLRGLVEKEERLLLFAFLQKAEDTFELD